MDIAFQKVVFWEVWNTDSGTVRTQSSILRASNQVLNFFGLLNGNVKNKRNGLSMICHIANYILEYNIYMVY